jgi:hypothetical protein
MCVYVYIYIIYIYIYIFFVSKLFTARPNEDLLTYTCQFCVSFITYIYIYIIFVCVFFHKNHGGNSLLLLYSYGNYISVSSKHSLVSLKLRRAF